MEEELEKVKQSYSSMQIEKSGSNNVDHEWESLPIYKNAKLIFSGIGSGASGVAVFVIYLLFIDKVKVILFGLTL